MNCISCNKDFHDLLRHLRNSKNCQSAYDMKSLVKERKLAQLAKKRCYMKKTYQQNKENILQAKKEHYAENKEDILQVRKGHYEENKEDILQVRKQHYEENKEQILQNEKNTYLNNKDEIRSRQAAYYVKSKSKICQRKRFRKHFTEKDAMYYLSNQQTHLYHHISGFCQPETMPDLNHSIESDDELCCSCKKMSAIKIIGINRLVCVSCKKAHCSVCKVEVSPNPMLGYLHFSPDPGRLLAFIPGYCPLYSTYDDLYSRSIKNECRICKQIKKEYPEYELFLGTEKDLFSYYKEKEREQMYICNLCLTSKKFVCQFDQHMRNHTKYGQRVTIITLKAEVERELTWGHLDEINFSRIEDELMETKGLEAVLTVFGIKQLKQEHYLINEIDLKDMNLGAALVFKPETEIEHELSKMFKKADLIEKYKVIYSKNYYIETYGLYAAFRKMTHKFEKLILFDMFTRDDSLWERNKAILENRCSLTYPNNTYKSTLGHSHLIERGIFIVYPKGKIEYKEEVLDYLWNIVKTSYLCCCVSEFFCSTSTNLGKCIEGCCGKCSKTEDETKQSISDSESQTTEEETGSDSESESNSKSSNNDQESDFMNNWSS